MNLDDPLSAKAQETATMCVDEAGILLLSVSEDREARWPGAGRFLARVSREATRISLTDDAEDSE